MRSLLCRGHPLIGMTCMASPGIQTQSVNLRQGSATCNTSSEAAMSCIKRSLTSSAGIIRGPVPSSPESDTP